MNIHLMPNEKFTEKFIELIDRCFDDDTNLVYVYDFGSHFDHVDSSNARYIQSFDQVDFSLMNGNDKIFVHGFYNNRLIRFLYKKRHMFRHNQLVLIAWGGDIYNDRIYLLDHKFDIKTRINEFFKKQVIKKSNIYMTFACADYEVIREYYGGKGAQFDCLYPSNADIVLLDKLKQERIADQPVRVLLGNSATITNNHKEALDWLSSYREDNIEIVCPLSYGDKNYAAEIASYGKSLFGDRFIPIFEYMSPEDYSKLLNSIHIAVFNHNRQQGTGNIEILSYLGKKIFISAETTTWEHYVNRDKCVFYDTKTINGMSFIEFSDFPEDKKTINETYFRKIWDMSYIKSLWTNVMEYGRNEG